MPSFGLPFQLVLSVVLEGIRIIEHILSGDYFLEDGTSYWEKLWSRITRIPMMIGTSSEPIYTTSSSFSFPETSSPLQQEPTATYTHVAFTPAPSVLQKMPFQNYYTQNIHVQPTPPLLGQSLRALGAALVPWAILVLVILKICQLIRTWYPSASSRTHQTTQTGPMSIGTEHDEASHPQTQELPKPSDSSPPDLTQKSANRSNTSRQRQAQDSVKPSNTSPHHPNTETTAPWDSSSYSQVQEPPESTDLSSLQLLARITTLPTCTSNVAPTNEEFKKLKNGVEWMTLHFEGLVEEVKSLRRTIAIMQQAELDDEEDGFWGDPNLPTRPTTLYPFARTIRGLNRLTPHRNRRHGAKKTTIISPASPPLRVSYLEDRHDEQITPQPSYNEERRAFMNAGWVAVENAVRGETVVEGDVPVEQASAEEPVVETPAIQESIQPTVAARASSPAPPTDPAVEASTVTDLPPIENPVEEPVVESPAIEESVEPTVAARASSPVPPTDSAGEATIVTGPPVIEDPVEEPVIDNPVACEVVETPIAAMVSSPAPPTDSAGEATNVSEPAVIETTVEESVIDIPVACEFVETPVAAMVSSPEPPPDSAVEASIVSDPAVENPVEESVIDIPVACAVVETPVAAMVSSPVPPTDSAGEATNASDPAVEDPVEESVIDIPVACEVVETPLATMVSPQHQSTLPSANVESPATNEVVEASVDTMMSSPHQPTVPSDNVESLATNEVVEALADTTATSQRPPDDPPASAEIIATELPVLRVDEGSMDVEAVSADPSNDLPALAPWTQEDIELFGEEVDVSMVDVAAQEIRSSSPSGDDNNNAGPPAEPMDFTGAAPVAAPAEDLEMKESRVADTDQQMGEASSSTPGLNFQDVEMNFGVAAPEGPPPQTFNFSYQPSSSTAPPAQPPPTFNFPVQASSSTAPPPPPPPPPPQTSNFPVQASSSSAPPEFLRKLKKPALRRHGLPSQQGTLPLPALQNFQPATNPEPIGRSSVRRLDPKDLIDFDEASVLALKDQAARAQEQAALVAKVDLATARVAIKKPEQSNALGSGIAGGGSGDGQANQQNVPGRGRGSDGDGRPVLTKPGCNLNGCYEAHWHRHTDEEEDEDGADGMWECLGCDDIYDHECIVDGRSGWSWSCLMDDDCEIKTKHEHPEAGDWDESEAVGLCDPGSAAEAGVGHGDYGAEVEAKAEEEEDDDSSDEEEEEEEQGAPQAGNDCGELELLDSDEASSFLEEAAQARGRA